VSESEDHVSCSFCGKGRKQVKEIVAGPGVYVCDGCVSRARAVIGEPDRTASTPIATIQQVSDEAGAGQCSFCGKHRNQVAGMASAGETQICSECLQLCDEIVRGVY